MSAFLAVHLALAGFCAGFGVLHLASWLVDRGQTTHRWTALTFATQAALAASLTGAAAPEAAFPTVWLGLATLAGMAAPPLTLLTGWALFDQRMRPWRWIVLGLLGLLLLPLPLSLIHDLSSPAIGWAQLGDRAWVGLPQGVASALLLGVWFGESTRMLTRHRRLGIGGMVASLLAALLVAASLLKTLGVVPGLPPLSSIVLLPLALTASLGLIKRAAELDDMVERRDLPYTRMMRLGAGGMGELWLAVRTGSAGFRRWVVIKRIRIDKLDRHLVERFLTEGRVAARLHHPNIVSVYDLDKTDAGWFMVMEYLPGPSLWDVMLRCYETRMFVPLGIVASICEQICRGLACAHGHSVMHRDISPDNIIVTFDGVTKLLDFGIAKESRVVPRVTSLDDDHHTALGGVVGKAQYLAPERLIGADASPESDLYSVGLVLVQLLGAPIPNVGAALADHERPVSAHRPDVPRAIEVIVCKALSSEPWARYRSALDMANDLRRIASHHPHEDLGVWIQQMFPERHDVQRRLERMSGPTPERVKTLFEQASRQHRQGPAGPINAPPLPQPSTVDPPSIPFKPTRPANIEELDPDSLPTVVVSKLLGDHPPLPTPEHHRVAGHTMKRVETPTLVRGNAQAHGTIVPSPDGDEHSVEERTGVWSGH